METIVSNTEYTNALFEETTTNDQYAIKDYYSNTTIFITGITGFVGKVLAEKLLRQCESVKCIYVLIRSKKGVNSKDRLAKILKSQIFDRIKSINVKLLDKIICISGDIAQEQLALSENDVKKIQNEVNIVFHSAATVRFDEPLKNALNLNSMGSKRIFELCRQIKQLKCVVYVSTAFCNPEQKVSMEKVYPARGDMDLETFKRCVDTLPTELTKLLGECLQGKHPNTYTLTKSIAEQTVAEYRNLYSLPICIVRPSIITPALAEPFPGWVDSLSGVTGVMIEVGRGTISSLVAAPKNIMDIIPVDFVCNLILAAAWYNTIKPIDCLRVFHCTSGQINPVLWEYGNRMVCENAQKYPTKYVMLYPNCTFRKNIFIHRFYEIFYHFMPAIFFDIYMKYLGMKPMMFNIAKRLKQAADADQFFTLNQWSFDAKNVNELIEAVRQTKDGDEFNFDIGSIVWKDYIKTAVIGTKKFILKDDIDNLPKARRILQKLYVGKWIYHILQFIFTLYLIVQLVTLIKLILL